MNDISNNNNKVYIAIDLKSYYASVECVDRNLDALTTNLVVADASRTEKTICLAVSPSLKAYGIPGRARLFEVVQKVKEVNEKRILSAPGRKFTGSSSNALELQNNPSLSLDYITATPRMNKYMEISSSIYEIYLQYVSSEDIHVYSIDECFLDVTSYLSLYKLSAFELCANIINKILKKTGITATGGIGTNMFLCKVAMDIVAKHVAPDENGVRIASLDEYSFRKQLWAHEPLTDFWRIGRGTANTLAKYRIYTMGDIARCSIGLPPLNQNDVPEDNINIDNLGRVISPDSFYNENLLYKLFGINAELLIDHAWGYEPTTMDLIKSYVPENNSISSGQVLSAPYPYDKARIIVREMSDLLSLDLVQKGLVADQIVLYVGYDIKNSGYTGEKTVDYYGRTTPKPAHGSTNLDKYTSSSSIIVSKTLELFDCIINQKLYIRRISITANHVISEKNCLQKEHFEQLNLFDLINKQGSERSDLDKEKEQHERDLQNALISIKSRFGKNAIIKGTNLQEGSTAIERNSQVGGHKG